MYPQYMFRKKNEILKKKIQRKIVIFTAVKNRCILHGRVFVMTYHWLNHDGSSQSQSQSPHQQLEVFVVFPFFFEGGN